MSGIMCALAGMGVMAPYVASYASGTTGGVNATTLTINKPAGVVSSNLMIGVMGGSDSFSWTGDTGWTEVVDQTTQPSLRVAHKTAGGSESASYAFTASASRALSGAIIRIPSGAFDCVGSVGVSLAAANIVAGAAPMTSAGRLIAVFFSSMSGRSFSTPAGMTLVAQDNDSDAPSWAIFEQEVSSGSTGTRTSKPSDNGQNAGILIGIKAA